MSGERENRYPSADQILRCQREPEAHGQKARPDRERLRAKGGRGIQSASPPERESPKSTSPPKAQDPARECGGHVREQESKSEPSGEHELDHSVHCQVES